MLLLLPLMPLPPLNECSKGSTKTRRKHIQESVSHCAKTLNYQASSEFRERTAQTTWLIVSTEPVCSRGELAMWKTSLPPLCFVWWICSSLYAHRCNAALQRMGWSSASFDRLSGWQLSYGRTTVIYRIGVCNVSDRNVRKTHIKKIRKNTNWADSETFDFSLFKICLIIYLHDLCNG